MITQQDNLTFSPQAIDIAQDMGHVGEPADTRRRAIAMAKRLGFDRADCEAIAERALSFIYGTEADY